MYKSVVLIIYFVLFIFNNTYSNSNNPVFEEEKNINKIIFNAPVHLIDGSKTTIAQLSNKTPLILALVFSRCKGVCNPLLSQLKSQLNIYNEKKGEKYSVLVLSFDTHDKLENLKNLASQYQLNDDEHWFWGINDSIDALNNSIGFYPKWNQNIQQFDHDAILIGINNTGFITQKLIGLRQQDELENLIKSINNIFVPTYRLPSNNLLFSCFNYNAETGKNKPGLGLIFILLPMILSIITIGGIRIYIKLKGGKLSTPNELH